MVILLESGAEFRKSNTNRFPETEFSQNVKIQDLTPTDLLLQHTNYRYSGHPD